MTLKMSLIPKFLALDLDERMLFIEVSILLISVKFCLKLVSFRKLLGAIERFSSSPKVIKQRDSAYAEKIARAVTRSGRYFLGKNTCLPQALVAYLLIRRRSQSVELKIGVRKGDEGILRAHAWVEDQGKILIGGNGIDLDRYVRLHDLNRVVS